MNFCVCFGERWDERGVPIGLDCFVFALQGLGRRGAGMSGLGRSCCTGNFWSGSGDIGILHHRYHLWYCKKEQAVCKVVGDSSRHRPDLHRAVLCRIGRRNVIFILDFQWFDITI